MTVSGQKFPGFGQKSAQSRDGSAARAVDWLRGVHPTKTAEQVEAATGIPAKTVRNWLCGAAQPGGDAMVRLVLAYGPDLICAMCDAAPAWLAASARAKRQGEIEAQQAALSAELAAMRGAA